MGDGRTGQIHTILDYGTPLNTEDLELRALPLHGGFSVMVTKCLQNKRLCFQGPREKEHLQRLSHFLPRPFELWDSLWKCSSPAWETEQNVTSAAEMREFSPLRNDQEGDLGV